MNPHTGVQAAIDALPGPQATLTEIVRFARRADPTEAFHRRWGDAYTTNAQALWQECVTAYKTGSAVERTADELRLCIAYDVALGPYLGVPEPHKLPFLRWLIDAVRRHGAGFKKGSSPGGPD